MKDSTGSQKAWGGVFREPTDKRVEAFSESVSFDQRLANDDIDGSIAHARMLAACGLITAQEADAIAQGLEEIRAEIQGSRFEFTASKEDIHLHIESALTTRLGDIGRKLHTARSRNDQVATDLRLYCRRAIDRIDHALLELQRAFLGFAIREQGLVIPGTPTCVERSPCSQRINCWPGVKSSTATGSGWPTAGRGRTSCRWAPGRSPARACRSTGST